MNGLLDFSSLGLVPAIGVFVVAAVAVWIAGTRLAGYADEIARRTGMGHALLGLLLLAGVTSLPEIATSFSAALRDNAELAVNNLLGSIALQVAVLAIADLFIHRRALTSVVPDPIVMLQGALNICLLCLVALAIITGDQAFFAAGVWTWGLLVAAVFSMRLLTLARGRKPWLANTEGEEAFSAPVTSAAPHEESNLVLGLKTAASALVILLAGWTVSLTGDSLAQQTGLGQSFMGVAFVALATSLPEASTSFGAVRRGNYTMAISDIFGTNILNVALLFGVDLIAPSSPVLSEAGDFAAVGAILGAIVTGLFLVGLAERRNQSFLRMGYDSFAVLITYLGGLALLYNLRSDG